MTFEEMSAIQQELFDFGAGVLQRSSFPKFEIGIDSVNFLALPEFQYFGEQFELGTTFTLDLDHYRVKPLLLEVFIDFEDLTNFRLVYANKRTLDSGFEFVKYGALNVNAVSAISFNLARIEAMRRNSDEMASFVRGTIDASHNRIVSSSVRTAITLDDLGMRARSYDANTGLELPYGSWWTGRGLSFSDDNFRSSRAVFGMLEFPGSPGGIGYGIATEWLIGNIVATNELHISNANNNFRLDETGAWLNNIGHSV